MPQNPKRPKKLGEALQLPLAYMGIYRSGPLEDQSVSLRSYVVLAIMGVYLIISLAYFVLESGTFQSYADCYWITTTTMIMFFVSITLVVKRRNLFASIDNFENIIENRKKYCNTNSLKFQKL